MRRLTLCWLLTSACVSASPSGCQFLFPACGGHGEACCGAGSCDDPLVCLAGTCADNQPSAPKTAAELCQLLAEGQARAGALEQLSAQTPLFSAAASPSCSFTASQLAAMQALQTELVAQVAQPTVSGDCADPQSQLSQLATQLALGLDAGTIAWNQPADSACAAGMQASRSLVAEVFDDGGTFRGMDQIFGDGGGSPCDEILQGQLVAGQACQNSLECQVGLFCQPTGSAGCGGFCAAPGGDGGELLLGSDQGTSVVSLGFITSATPGEACESDLDCFPCLTCAPSGVCATVPGAQGSGCAQDLDCPGPGLWCLDGGCQPAQVLGGPCDFDDPASCLIGSCVGSPPTCALAAGLGDACHPTLSGTAACDAGFCGQLDGGPFACLPFLALDAGCAAGTCAPGSQCDPASLSCQPLLPTGATCGSDGQCQSGTCLLGEGEPGVCQSPCILPPSGGCGGIGLYNTDSFWLGLGGAMILGRRRRRSDRGETSR